ncbi:hypothetical protein [Halostella sp. PRR32]|uniref:hypothetical protein n=1 Tax=Halostella sp. PRR32 TaxID=3098147 RepID=UPI002B1D0225|nr:hypothetical protein [Halostella sp. PRR32]
MGRFARVRRLVDRWNDLLAVHPFVRIALLVLVPLVAVTVTAYALGDDLISATLQGIAFGVTYATVTVVFRGFSSSD